MAQDHLEDAAHWVHRALWRLDDRLWLDECPLVTVPSIIEAARPLRHTKFCAKGFVVKQRLESALKAVAADLGPASILGALALARLNGATNASVARRFGIREETISRTHMPRLVGAVVSLLVEPSDLAA